MCAHQSKLVWDVYLAHCIQVQCKNLSIQGTNQKVFALMLWYCIAPNVEKSMRPSQLALCNVQPDLSSARLAHLVCSGKSCGLLHDNYYAGTAVHGCRGCGISRQKLFLRGWVCGVGSAVQWGLQVKQRRMFRVNSQSGFLTSVGETKGEIEGCMLVGCV